MVLICCILLVSCKAGDHGTDVYDIVKYRLVEILRSGFDVFL